MSFQGDIPSISLGDVIQNITVNKNSGTLSIRSGKIECHIRFQSGRIVSYSDIHGTGVLDWLVDKEIVPATHREDVLRRYKRAKRKTLGAILDDMGLLALDTYQSYLRNLIQEGLYDVLSLRQGTFAFRTAGIEGEMEDRELEALGLELNPTSLLMEAARRTDDWQKIRKHIPSENEIYVPSSDNLEELLEEIDVEVNRDALSLMDGVSTLRQVINRLPYSRFEACRAIAQLVSEKKVRPLDGDILLQSTSDDEDPDQTIARLTAILEREPNNREILTKLADLHEKNGSREESAVCTKILAISFLEDGDHRAGEQCLRKSLSLNPKDHSTWQRLWETISHQGEQESVLLFGKQFVAHFRRLGLTEVARDRLLELIDRFPERQELKVELADIRFGLGDRGQAIKELTEIGNKLLKKEPYEAEKIFARILRYDHENERARKLCDEISSGRLSERRARRRRFVHRAVTVSLLMTLCAQLGFEMYVHGKFFQATKSVFAEGLLEKGDHGEAMRRIEEVRRDYPFSLTSLYKAPPLIEALQEGQSNAGKGGDAASPSGKSPESRPASGDSRQRWDEIP